MLQHELGDAIVDAPELPVRCDRTELVIGELDREIDVAPVAGIDDVRQRSPHADEELRDALDRPLQRQSHAHRHATGSSLTNRIEALEREREMRTALVLGHGVDFVDDHRAHAAERSAPFGRQQT